jgi:hypothetical protein
MGQSGKGGPMDTGWVAFSALFVLDGLFAVAWKPFLAAYVAKKGERLATSEDIEKLVHEVRAVTSATEKIKSDISAGLWDYQTRWSLKRDTYFRVIEILGELRKHLADFVAFSFELPQSDGAAKASAQCDALRADLQRFAGIAFLVIGEQAKYAFEEYRSTVEPFVRTQRTDRERWDSELKGVDLAINRLIAEARRDLGLSVGPGRESL